MHPKCQCQMSMSPRDRYVIDTCRVGNCLVFLSPRLSALILLNPCEFAASGRSIYRGLRRPSSLGAGVFISGRLGICPTPGRGPPAAGALRPSWRPRAMVEPAGKSVRTDWADLALLYFSLAFRLFGSIPLPGCTIQHRYSVVRVLGLLARWIRVKANLRYEKTQLWGESVISLSE